MNAEQARWLDFLCEFEFDIKHVKIKENKVVDALNKKFHIASMSTCKSNLNIMILKAMTNDDFYFQVKEGL